MTISRSVLLIMRNVSDRFVEKIKTHILYSAVFLFRKSCLLLDSVGNIVDPDRPQMTINVAHALCILDNYGYRHALCEYVILIGLPWQQRSGERASVFCLYVRYLSC